MPSGITATGWPRIEKICREKLGVRFDRWQDGAGRVILAERADGKLAATIGGVGMSLPRQVGKTYLLAGLIFGLCIERPGLLVIWSAHHSRTHGETFLAMQAFAKRAKVAPYIEQVFKGSGDEEIRFHNGSRILFGARERGFGRGVPGVDVMVCDEAQILSDKALEDMLATLNTSQFGLALYIGTPPKPEDNSESFVRMRTEALSGESDDLVWIECGADKDDDPADPRTWAKANPSYPHRTPDESILRLKRKLKDSGFKREGLGIWDELDLTLAVIPSAVWDALEADGPADGTPPSGIGVDASHDGILVVAACWRSDDMSHLELLAADEWNDDEAAADWIAGRAGRRIPVIIDGASPAARLIPLLKSRRIKVLTGGPSDMSKACIGFYTGALGGKTTHGGEGDDLVGKALEGAVKRKIGEAGGWGWDRRDPETNIAPLVAETLARYIASHVVARRSERSGGSYQRR